jgi:hypothetical protein
MSDQATPGSRPETFVVRPAEPTLATVRIVIAGESFEAAPDRPFVFGRADAEGVVGLDSNDMGISAVAGSVEATWGVWWFNNMSTKRPLLLQDPSEPAQRPLAPGHRHALTTDRATVLVPGVIYTHALEIMLPDAYVSQLQAGGRRMSTGTVTGAVVTITPADRDALVALFAGYLEAFPRRREHPNTYQEAARLLGGEPWTGDRVRKAVERVKERYAKGGVYFQGPQANYELAANLISNGILTGEDLSRLAGRSGR